MNKPLWNRRAVMAAAGAAALLPVARLGADESMHTKSIPSSDEALPVIGLGTYSVLDVESVAIW